MRIPLIYFSLELLYYLILEAKAFQCNKKSHVTVVPSRLPSSWRRQALFKEEETSKSFLFQDNAKTIRVENDAHADEIHKKEDDKVTTQPQFSVGDSVRVIIPDIRAYQIPTTAHGTYENGMFVANESLKYLVIPVGLQGTVEKVYDTAASGLSANLPIRVAFTQSSDEKQPQPPVDFTMYFAIAELELVTK